MINKKHEIKIGGNPTSVYLMESCKTLVCFPHRLVFLRILSEISKGGAIIVTNLHLWLISGNKVAFEQAIKI